MQSLLNISERTSLAFHGLVLIAKKSPERINVKFIAEQLKASEAHLAKIFQKLNKSGIISSVRGPMGGFVLNQPAEDISFLNIYETLESKVSITRCPLLKEKCSFDKCIFSGKLTNVVNDLYKTLKDIKLSDFTEKHK
jgi:Rrf2 family protein